MSPRLFLFTVALCSCRDPATLVGTALLISVDSSEVAVEQLRYEATLDGGAIFEPTVRPEAANGLLAPSTLVRVLLRDELGGQVVEVKATGLVTGAAVGVAKGQVRVERGFERLIALKLSPPMLSCAGCIDSQGTCVATPGVGACGVNGAACQACDTRLADSCTSNGTCGCGGDSACSAALGADRCANGHCQCGAGPSCEAGQECLAQTCQCTPNSCAGCCVGDLCITNPSSANCGSGGRACLDCGVTACTGGQCVLPVCNATTCPTGCCMGSTCITALGDQACGRGGMACTSCGVGSCDVDAGVCTGGCSSANCPSGCCQAGVCQPGTQATACGRGGSACASCQGACTNQACAAPCGPSTCPNGCCQGGICRLGRSTSVCGTGGVACVACGSQDTCPSGTCVVSSSCNSTTCAGGCCSGTTCITPPTAANCGLVGRTCRTCSAPRSDGCNPSSGSCACGNGQSCNVGQACDGGRCVCDPQTCAGCCSGTECVDGTKKSTCGLGGATCQSCSGARQCVDGGCAP